MEFSMNRMSLEVRRATAPWRPLPDFLIIGADESGARYLYRALSEHSAVCRSAADEVHFFDVRYTYGRRWYRAQFPTRSRRKAIERRIGMRTIAGEVSPYYLFHPFAPSRVADAVPEAKLVALLRNPIERAILRYELMVQLGKEHRSLEDALIADERRLEEGRSFEPYAYDDPNGPARHHTYLERGHYDEQLQRWYHCFDVSRLLVLEARTVTAPEGVRRVLDFLGLSDGEQVPSIPFDSCPPVNDALWTKLSRHFAPHNERLFHLLGEQWDWDGWSIQER
jgi:Sulfotransferase domain